MWGNVIQDLLRNYMMMKLMQDKEQPPDPLQQAATVGPVGGQDSTLPGGPMGAPPPTPMQLQDPQLMQLIMQMLMRR